MSGSVTGDRHCIGGVPSQQKPAAWIKELRYEEPSEITEFIFKGIMFGFPIIDEGASIEEYDCHNYKSSVTGPAFEMISQLFTSEIKDNKIIVSSEKPKCIHAVGAVPKSDGKVRPITDCKRPIGISVNNFMTTTWEEFSFESIDNVTRSLCKGDFIATVDITSAYRSVTIRPEHWKYMGLRWKINGQDTLLNDTRLCFGQKCAPFIFSALSSFVVRCMHRRGFVRTFCYLDDFVLIGESFEACQRAQLTLINLLGELGFLVNWAKCSSPAKECVYLGISIDTEEMTVSLPQKKMEKLRKEIRFFENKSRASKKQLQRLAGVLGHCARVIRGGRLFRGES